MAGVTYIPRVFGGTIVIIPPLTPGPVTTVIADQAVNNAQLTDAARAQATLTDQPKAIAVLSEKVV